MTLCPWVQFFLADLVNLKSSQFTILTRYFIVLKKTLAAKHLLRNRNMLKLFQILFLIGYNGKILKRKKPLKEKI